MKKLSSLLFFVAILTAPLAAQAQFFTFKEQSANFTPVQNNTFTTFLSPSVTRETLDQVKFSYDPSTQQGSVTTDSPTVSYRSLLLIGYAYGLSLNSASLNYTLERDRKTLIDASFNDEESKVRRELSLEGDIHPFQEKMDEIEWPRLLKWLEHFDWISGIYVGAGAKRVWMALPGTHGYDKEFDRVWGYNFDVGYRNFVGHRHQYLMGFKFSINNIISPIYDSHSLYNLQISLERNILSLPRKKKN